EPAAAVQPDQQDAQQPDPDVAAEPGLARARPRPAQDGLPPQQRQGPGEQHANRAGDAVPQAQGAAAGQPLGVAGADDDIASEGRRRAEQGNQDPAPVAEANEHGASSPGCSIPDRAALADKRPRGASDGKKAWTPIGRCSGTRNWVLHTDERSR